MNVMNGGNCTLKFTELITNMIRLRNVSFYFLVIMICCGEVVSIGTLPTQSLFPSLSPVVMPLRGSRRLIPPSGPSPTPRPTTLINPPAQWAFLTGIS
jgi:hypothetical protein